MPKLDQNANKTLAEAQTLGNLHPDARAQAIARGSREDALVAALRTHDGDAPDGWQFGLGLVKFDAHGQFADFRWATQADIDAAIQRAAPQAQPVLTINSNQIAHMGMLIDSDGDEPTELCIQYKPPGKDTDGEDAPGGLYAWITEYPEEGSIFLDPDAAPKAQPAHTEAEVQEILDVVPAMYEIEETVRRILNVPAPEDK